MSETRKLAAILVSDVVGYSRLTGADEDRILARLRTLRSDLIDPIIAVHHGRIVKRTGDGAIVEFRSVVDAVNLAVEVQRAMVERNAEVAPDKRIEFRVGIHFGTVGEMSDGTPSMRAARSREKLFGLGRPRALDRNAKVWIMHWARCLSRRTEKGRAYGEITAKALAVLEALLWAFHNARSGLCFPSYEKIAEVASCARSTVAEALKALEDAGVLSGFTASNGCGRPPPISSTATAGAGGSSGPRTPTTSGTRSRLSERRFLLSPKSRREPQIKPFSLLCPVIFRLQGATIR
jgi:hypothetical protein